MLEPLPSHVDGPLLEVEIDWAKTMLLLVECLKFGSQEEEQFLVL